MAARLTVTSYAKVNYTLDVLSKRPDGYHNIATVLQAVSLSDTIEMTAEGAPGVRLECDAPGVPADSTNLAYRAAESALAAAESCEGVRIRLTKRIPAQAGLGGGSSNAAATLRGVNALLGLGLSDSDLLSLAAELGSDVPFFLAGGAASARGRGEALTPLPDGPPLWFVIVKPDVGVSTAWAYEALDAIPNRSSARASRAMEELLRAGDAERIVSRMTNDFEQAVIPAMLPIALLFDDFLMARARNVRLCGSGSAVFGAAFSEPEAEEIARLMRLKYSSVHICRTLTRSESLHLPEAAE